MLSTASERVVYSSAPSPHPLTRVSPLASRRSPLVPPLQGQHEFKPDFKSAWYVAGINHADGTCRNGDGALGRDRQPCRWYRQRQW